MKAFLSKFFDADKVNEIEEAYKAKNPDAQGLPIYIPKSRFDEIDGKRKTAEEALKAVPTDWKDQIAKLNEQLRTQKDDYEGKLAAKDKLADCTAKIYSSGARNVKAVMALIDQEKPIEDQLKALRESDPYLFKGSNGGMGKGTGKGTGDTGGEGDDGGKPSEKLSAEAMYRAVGIVPPQV